MVKENAFSQSETLKGVDSLMTLLQMRAKTNKGELACGFLSKGEELTIQLTFDELDLSARVIAGKLQELAKKGERAIMLYPSGLEFVSAFMGCAYSGIIPVPVYPPQMGKQIDRILSILKDSKASLFLTCQSVMNSIKRNIPELVEANPDAWIVTDEIEEKWADEWIKPEISAGDIAFLQYTSGSTGTPKGVCVTHANLLHNEEMIKMGFGLENRSEISVMGWLPLFHDMGLIGTLLHPLYLGKPIYMMSPLSFIQRPFRWLKAISDHKLTVSGGPNFGYSLCIDKVTDEEVQQLDLSNWQVAFCGAEPVQAETLKRFAEKFAPAGFREESFYPCYGMAETTLFVTGKGNRKRNVEILKVNNQGLARNSVEEVEDDHPNKVDLVSCGFSWMEEKVLIVNPDTKEKCEENQVGEIWVSGKNVATGYWQKPEVTKEVFEAYTSDNEGPFLRTGDLGFLRENELYITGRQKDLIIIRGKNHYPQDIELTVAESHESLRVGGGAAFSIEKYGEEKIVIIQEIARGALKSTSEETIFTEIKKQIALRHELQVYAIALIKQRSIPKTSSGKIQRKATKEAFLNQKLIVEAEWMQEGQVVDTEEEVVNVELTESDIQSWIINWMSKELDITTDRIDADESIQAYGVDSMGTARFEEDISKLVGFKWPVNDMLINEPSIIEISQRGAELIEDNKE